MKSANPANKKKHNHKTSILCTCRGFRVFATKRCPVEQLHWESLTHGDHCSGSRWRPFTLDFIAKLKESLHQHEICTCTCTYIVVKVSVTKMQTHSAAQRCTATVPALKSSILLSAGSALPLVKNTSFSCLSLVAAVSPIF